MAAVHAVVDMGSYRDAAAKLRLAQSVVSAHVQNFEQWFDYPIFKAGLRAPVPTMEGEEALRCSRNVLHRHEQLVQFACKSDASLTLRQIEAFYWLANLGSVVQAADKLNITQAATSRRLQEFSARCLLPVFATSRQSSVLTNFGTRVLKYCEAVMHAFGELRARRSDAHTPETVLHIGITELVALTWFPAFVRGLKEAHPSIVLHPDVDIATSLQEKLLTGQLDAVIIPQPALTVDMTPIKIGSTAFAWFCAPGTFGTRKRISLSALASKPLLVQGRASGITMIAQQLFSRAGLAPRQVFGSNSLVALAGLIESGIGVSCLPRSLFSDLVKQNRLQIIESTTPPKATYYLAFVNRKQSSLCSAVAVIAKKTCQF